VALPSIGELCFLSSLCRCQQDQRAPWYPDFTTAAYVGMSRARTRLVVLAPETLPDALRRALEG